MKKFAVLAIGTSLLSWTAHAGMVQQGGGNLGQNNAIVNNAAANAAETNDPDAKNGSWSQISNENARVNSTDRGFVMQPSGYKPPGGKVQINVNPQVNAPVNGCQGNQCQANPQYAPNQNLGGGGPVQQQQFQQGL